MKLPRSMVLAAVVLAGLATASAQTCSAPTLAMFNICSPFHETSVANPITVSAAATPPQCTITSLQLWIDGTKYLNSTTNTLTGTLPTLTSGKHRFTFIMTSTSSTGGRQWNTIVYVNVQ
jgi:Big-like domain-containing protein